MSSVGSEHVAQNNMVPLLEGLEHGLHAFAQPLTILRSRTDTSRLAQQTPEQLRDGLLQCSEQVDSLCSLLHYLQQLVDTASILPRFSEFSLNDILTEAIEGIELFLREANVDWLLEDDRGALFVVADRSRALQALSGVLLSAVQLSSSGDTLEICASFQKGQAIISVRNNASVDAHPSATTRLRLALVETCLTSQSGSFAYSANPLIFRIELPYNENNVQRSASRG